MAGLIRFTVYGVAQPAGSKRAFALRRNDGSIVTRPGGAPVINMVDDAEKGGAWRQEVAKSALLAKRAAGLSDVLRGPLALRVVFHRQRPKGHYNAAGLLSKLGKATPWPSVKPDSTKLVRAVEDALTSVLWEDDAQVVRQSVEKVWGLPSRAEIEIEGL